MSTAPDSSRRIASVSEIVGGSPGVVVDVALRSLQLRGETFLGKLADARQREEAKLGCDADHGAPAG
jgi:hypothetical protein